LFGQQVTAEINKHILQLVGTKFSEALKYADASMWDEASKKVDALNSSVSFELLQWLKLRAGTKEFSEYEAFLLVNADWPGMDLLRSQGEKVITPSVQSARLYNYFSNNNPLTANGSLSYAEVLLSDQEIKKAQGVMKESWLNHSYSANELERANKLFGAFLEQLNEQRIDNLLWSGRTEQAEMMLSLVPTDIRFLSEARIALKRQNVGVDALISKVPKHLKTSPGLLFDRFSYRQKKICT
jgi:soluble lytic murein transglycosylase